MPKWTATELHLKAFETGLSHLVSLGRVPSGLTIQKDPQPVYVFKSDEVKGKILPKDAKPASWQYTAGDSPQNIVVGEVSDSLPPKLISMKYGPSAWPGVEARKEALRRPDVVGGQTEPLHIRIPDAVIQGIWLKSKADLDDLIVSFGAIFDEDPPGFQPSRLNDLLNRRAVYAAKEARPGTVTN